MYGIYEGGQVIARFVVPMAVRSNHPVFGSDTFSLTRQVARRTAQRWEIETRVEPLSHSAQDLFVNLVTKGYSYATQVLVPQNYGAVRARVLSTTSVTATGTANIAVIAVANNDGTIPKGTFIKFTGHDKVYMTTTNLTGNGALGIYPALRTDIAPGTLFQWTDNVIMQCLFDFDMILGMQYSDGILMDIGTIRLIERLA
jgi:hypothetical protein